MSTALDVAHLTVAFGRTEILRDVSFRVDSGTTLAIIGPNGSGKTVLLRALIGAVPAQGTIAWAPGTRMGYVPQKLDIERDLPITGSDFLRAKANVFRAPHGEIPRVLSLVDLAPDVAAAPIGTLSGGQFQRLLLGFALVGRPTVLLFDEPTAGLDEPAGEGIHALLQRLQREEGLTLLLISHELSLVYRFADSVLCLSRRRAWLGPPIEVLTPEGLQKLYGTAMKFHLHDDAGV